jgi:hypothetical protein
MKGVVLPIHFLFFFSLFTNSSFASLKSMAFGPSTAVKAHEQFDGKRQEEARKLKLSIETGIPVDLDRTDFELRQIELARTRQQGRNPDEPITLFRGYSIRGFGVSSLIAYLGGKQEYEPRSWEYSRTVSELQRRAEDPTASRSAERIVTERIEEKLAHDPNGSNFTWEQMGLTLSGIPDDLKRGLALAASVGDLETSIGYARGNLWRHSHFPEGQIAVVLKIKQPKPRGIPDSAEGNEFFIFSHIPLSEVEGVYVGLPKDWPSEEWFYFDISKRGPKGAVTEVAAHRVPTTTFQGEVAKRVRFLEPDKIGEVTLDGMSDLLTRRE